MSDDNKHTYIKKVIDELNNEIDILRDNIFCFKRKILIFKSIAKLLMFISTTIGIILIGSICNVNVFIMLFYSMSLITVNILINDFINKMLNKKYNIGQIRELIRGKEILLSKYKDKEKVIINELNIVREDYYKNNDMMLVSENINKKYSNKVLNDNIKVKKKTKKS